MAVIVSPRKLPLEQSPGIAKSPIGPQNCGGLISHVHHAVLAARITPAAILFPVRFFDEVLKRCMMAVGNQVTRRFPTPWVVSGISPSGAQQVFAFSAQEV